MTMTIVQKIQTIIIQNFRTHNLLEKLKTSNIFIQDFFKFFCVNHGFRLNYIELNKGFKSDFKKIKDAGKYDKALLYQKTELISPVKYIQYKELMKTDEWADKSSYEKDKVKKEVDKFNDLVKLKMNTSPYTSYGIYQYDKLVDMYDSLDNSIEWIYNFQTERKDIINKQIKYLRNGDI